MVGRDGQQVPEEGERLLVYRLVLLAAVRVLHDGHPAAGKVEELLARPLEGREGQGGGTCVEVHRTAHGRQCSW